MANLSNWAKISGVTVLLVVSTLILAIPQASASTALCGANITSSTTLTEDVGPCLSDAIGISANNVIFNCNGHTVTGSGVETGIQTGPGVSGVTIENCYVTNFVYGILLGNGGNDQLLNNHAYLNTMWGFFIVSHDSLIQNNMANNNAQGGFVFEGCNLGSECPGGTSFGYDNQVTNNMALKNGQNAGENGFGFVGAIDYQLTNNKAVNNTGDGFAFFPNGNALTNGNTLTNNKAVNNGAFGYFDSSTGSGTAGTADTYTRNVCEANTSGGSSPAGLC
jgi:parallel beta-helix repeat protein